MGLTFSLTPIAVFVRFLASNENAKLWRVQMLKFFLCVVSALVFNLSVVQADDKAPVNPQQQSQSPSALLTPPNDKTVFVPMEPDQTDIFAIPLDEDAYDQQEELEHLEHPHSSTNPYSSIHP
jgi:hypothetical protein